MQKPVLLNPGLLAVHKFNHAVLQCKVGTPEICTGLHLSSISLNVRVLVSSTGCAIKRSGPQAVFGFGHDWDIIVSAHSFCFVCEVVKFFSNSILLTSYYGIQNVLFSNHIMQLLPELCQFVAWRSQGICL